MVTRLIQDRQLSGHPDSEGTGGGGRSQRPPAIAPRRIRTAHRARERPEGRLGRSGARTREYGRRRPARRPATHGIRRIGVGMEVGEPRRGDIYLVSLDPTRGSEIRKTRPCLIVSPDETQSPPRDVPGSTDDHWRSLLPVPRGLPVSGERRLRRTRPVADGGSDSPDQACRATTARRDGQCAGCAAKDVCALTPPGTALRSAMRSVEDASELGDLSSGTTPHFVTAGTGGSCAHGCRSTRACSQSDQHGTRITARNLPKSNWDCTICRSCRRGVSGVAGLKWRGNRFKWRAFCGPLRAPLAGADECAATGRGR